LGLLVNHLIDVARGEVPADLLLRGAQIANVLTGEVYPSNVAIAGVGKEYRGGKRSWIFDKGLVDVSQFRIIPLEVS
jgi:hypothetical protein